MKKMPTAHCIATNCKDCLAPCFRLVIDRGFGYNFLCFEIKFYKECVERYIALANKGQKPVLKLYHPETGQEIPIHTDFTKEPILIL